MRWHLLPTDEHVVAAIVDRQEQLRQLYKEHIDINANVEENWIWHHLFTVLDHSKKIFETPVDNLVEDTKQETK